MPSIFQIKSVKMCQQMCRKKAYGDWSTPQGLTSQKQKVYLISNHSFPIHTVNKRNSSKGLNHSDKYSHCMPIMMSPED